MVNALIVDDAEYCRIIVAEALTAAGHTIVGEAENGAEAVEKYKELRPDVTIMDITMPVMDGISALKKIMEFDSDAKVVIVTTSGQDRIKAEALALGAVKFVTKDSDYHELTKIVSNLATDPF